MKLHTYTLHAIILIAISSSAFAANNMQIVPSITGIKWGAALGGAAVTTAIGGAATFAAYKSSNLPLWQRCAIPAAASILSAAGCRMYASARSIKLLREALNRSIDTTPQSDNSQEIIALAQNGATRPQAETLEHLDLVQKKLRQVGHLANILENADLNNPTERANIQNMLQSQLRMDRQAMQVSAQETWRAEETRESITRLEEMLKILASDNPTNLSKFVEESGLQMIERTCRQLAPGIAAALSAAQNMSPTEAFLKTSLLNKFSLGSWLSATIITCASLYYYVFTK